MNFYLTEKGLAAGLKYENMKSYLILIIFIISYNILYPKT